GSERAYRLVNTLFYIRVSVKHEISLSSRFLNMPGYTPFSYAFFNVWSGVQRSSESDRRSPVDGCWQHFSSGTVICGTGFGNRQKAGISCLFPVHTTEIFD
ncbi:MAG: hypothetical protein WA151_16940, partial [Desulfatirhabdiaceae bacterium]